MLKHQPPFNMTDSAFHVVPWNVKLSYQTFQNELANTGKESSSQELINNVLRFLIFTSGAIECELVLFPPDKKASLFPSTSAYIVSMDSGKNISAPKDNGTVYLTLQEVIRDETYGEIGKIHFNSIPGYRYLQTKYTLEIVKNFFIQLYRMLFLQRDSENLRQAYLQMLFQIANRIDNNKYHMKSHGSHTAKLAKSIAHQLGCNPEQSMTIYYAGVFHDIGKIIIPDMILNKPAPLDHEEWHIVRNHASFGASLFDPLFDLHNLMPIIRGHHEWVDGSGYPDKLSGEQIPTGARILSVADAYSTMIDGRTYQHKKSPMQAKKEMQRCRDIQFDPHIVDALFSLLPEE
jgi:HD-GYP domain-containing protein (c-di-GMP phosphodiesterase class II)